MRIAVHSFSRLPTRIEFVERTHVVAGELYKDPGRIFESTAPHYGRFRRPYPALLVGDLVHQALEHTAAPRMLDLGCGPGPVGLELAAHGIDVIAVDPSSEMLAAGRSAAAERGLLVDWRLGTGETVREQKGVGNVTGAVIADAFHWMDRSTVLRQLHEVVAPRGFVAVLCSRAAGTPQPWWHEVIAQVRSRFVGRVPAAGAGQDYRVPEGDHETLLRLSQFSRIAVARAEHTVQYTVDELVGLQFTYAYSSPVLLGDRAREFADAVGAALLAVEPSGVFTATVTAALITGRRA